ncbi:class I SAM-dependent methyltransferase [Streptomyces spinoverrucosus]|uniref:class I SAM-dependent methyltransferase n=1 Tax=Streptomyces spinoverrucosus TaxID=284043 RepID=UPI001E3D2BA2|nr:class I SAM-dependent methyltransferase [Streptomyces spinoverrucosus]
MLDVGAGTGRVTLMSLLESRVGVHAVEPARAMRAPLMTRLASLPAELRERVTVHPQTLEEAELRDVADVAICHNTIACLAPAERRALWPALAQALVPGGSLLLQLPPAHLPDDETERDFPLREHTETFWMWPASRAAMISDLAEHGFALLPGGADPAVLAMTLTLRDSSPEQYE